MYACNISAPAAAAAAARGWTGGQGGRAANGQAGLCLSGPSRCGIGKTSAACAGGLPAARNPQTPPPPLPTPPGPHHPPPLAIALSQNSKQRGKCRTRSVLGASSTCRTMYVKDSGWCGNRPCATWSLVVCCWMVWALFGWCGGLRTGQGEGKADREGMRWGVAADRARVEKEGASKLGAICSSKHQPPAHTPAGCL